MGINDRDDEYRSRGQAPRRRGQYEGSEPPAGRSYQRGSRADIPRARSRGDDEMPPSRGSGRRDYASPDDPRPGSSSRYERGAPDRRPRPDQSQAPGRRMRDDWGDEDTAMRRDRRGGDPYARGDRMPRDQRSPARDDWETSARPRGAPRGQGPADSGARGRRPGAAVAPARGGLWGDDAQVMATGARRRPDLRDPRAARRGAPQQEEEEETSSPGAAIGKALMAIVLALALGAGAAYGYYMFSTPKIPANVGQPSSTPAAGFIPAPSTHALVGQNPSAGPVAFVIVGGNQG